MDPKRSLDGATDLAETGRGTIRKGGLPPLKFKIHSNLKELKT
jgi:hypothetical protein